MLELFTALFITIADKILGTESETRQMVAKSVAANTRQEEIMSKMISNTHDILEQDNLRTNLIVEQMKVDNERFKTRLENSKALQASI